MCQDKIDHHDFSNNNLYWSVADSVSFVVINTNKRQEMHLTLKNKRDSIHIAQT